MKNIENVESNESEAAPEEDLRALLIGKKPEHYIPIFNDLDTTGGICWNWCGFFFAPMWFAYRKMYGWAVIAVIAPIVISFIIGFIMAAAYVSDAAMDIVSRLLSLCFAIVFGGIANKVYKRRIHRLVQGVPADENAKADYIKRKGGVNAAAMIVFLIVYVLIYFASVALTMGTV